MFQTLPKMKNKIDRFLQERELMFDNLKKQTHLWKYTVHTMLSCHRRQKSHQCPEYCQFHSGTCCLWEISGQVLILAGTGNPQILVGSLIQENVILKGSRNNLSWVRPAPFPPYQEGNVNSKTNEQSHLCLHYPTYTLCTMSTSLHCSIHYLQMSRYYKEHQ